jgi:hypothetical protein
MGQHKDQKRVQEVVVPHLIGRIVSEDPTAVRDCVVLNRLLVQGPDPLYLMETCPTRFAEMCDLLGLSVEDGRAGIESAHWQGPAVLLDGTGLPFSIEEAKAKYLRTSGPWGQEWALPLKVKQEIVWLLLASFSDCTEEGYTEDMSITQRLRRATSAACAFDRVIAHEMLPGAAIPEVSTYNFVRAAIHAAKTFKDKSPLFLDKYGYPHTENDSGFFVAYKAGYHIAAVHTTGPTFWGTTPSASLAELPFKVGKEISPTFGLVFEDSKAAYEAVQRGEA